MGGASVSTFAREGKTGVWSGEVKVVQSLGAPGFCTLRTKDSQVFPDASTSTHIGLHLTDGSGLPTGDFTMSVGVKGVTARLVAHPVSPQHVGGDTKGVDFDLFAHVHPAPSIVGAIKGDVEARSGGMEAED